MSKAIEPICKNCRFAVWMRHEKSGRINANQHGTCTHPIFEAVRQLNAGPIPECAMSASTMRPCDVIEFRVYGRPSAIGRESTRHCVTFEPIMKGGAK
jgi:hypothetical protein